MTILLVIDGNSLGMRAAMAIPKSGDLMTREGIPTGSFVRFFNMFNKILMQIQPTHICVAWDTDSNTFRKQLYPEYKANRHKKKLPDGIDLNIVHKQFKFIRIMLEKLGIKSINIAGYEGDDICGSVVAKSQADMNYIVSGDRDTWSLINDNTQIIYPKSGFTDFNFIDYKYVEDKYSITVEQYIGLKTLQGDTSDNIFGYEGCGPKIAAKMLNEFGSTDIIAKLKEEDLTNYNKTIKKNLKDWQERYEILKQLVTIKTDLPLPYDFTDFEIGLLKWNEIKPLLQDLEMYNFINRIAFGAVYRLKY